MNKPGTILAALCLFAGLFSGSVFCAEISEPSAVNIQEIIRDEIVETILKERDIQKPGVHTVYDYKSTVKIPVKISIKEKIKSENDVYIGQEIKFEVEDNVFYKRKLKIRKGQIVKAKVGLIISSGMNGIPASIVFEDFKIDNVENGKLQNTLEVFGQDRSLIVFLIKWALTILPPTGSLTNFIMGGHARIRQGKTFTIYYHPEWL